jgi:ADP-heptose:LPS heptosyltransferase
MKIGILQLARFGDIVLCWPLVRGLKRRYPGAEITMIVREAFAEALDGLTALDHVVTLNSKHILEPLWTEFFDAQEASQRIESFIDDIDKKKFDWIINLSFSPLSADLCSFFEGKCKITGYSRYPDDTLRIHGDVAQYFFDQVGVKRWNRLHLLNIFSRMLGLQLSSEDFYPPSHFSPESLDALKLPISFISVHIGGSEAHKVLDEIFLVEFLSIFLGRDSREIVLLGSIAEAGRAQVILESLPEETRARVHNLVGKTRLEDLYQILASADFHLGGDSLPIQMTMLTQTPTVLISFDGTRFWETGPLVRGSLVLKYKSDNDLSAIEVNEFIGSWINGIRISSPRVHVSLGFSNSNSLGTFVQQWEEWTWQDLFQDLLNELYFDSSERGFVYLSDIPVVKDGVEQLLILHLTVLDFLSQGKINANQQREIAQLALRVDELSQQIGEHHPALAGIVRWAEGVKSQIQPGSFDQIIEQSRKTYSSIRKKIEMIRNNGSLIQSQMTVQFDQEDL